MLSVYLFCNNACDTESLQQSLLLSDSRSKQRAEARKEQKQEEEQEQQEEQEQEEEQAGTACHANQASQPCKQAFCFAVCTTSCLFADTFPS